MPVLPKLAGEAFWAKTPYHGSSQWHSKVSEWLGKARKARSKGNRDKTVQVWCLQRLRDVSVVKQGYAQRHSKVSEWLEKARKDESEKSGKAGKYASFAQTGWGGVLGKNAIPRFRSTALQSLGVVGKTKKYYAQRHSKVSECSKYL